MRKTLAHMPPAIAVFPESPSLRTAAEQLSARLGLPVTEDNEEGFDLLLTLTPERLELRQTGPLAPGPVYIDFTGGAVDYRRRRGGGRGQAIARAIGLKKESNPTVLDATAGLGRDAFVLAALGCRVHLIERSPIVATLLEDGLKRAATDPRISEVIYRMQLSVGQSLDIFHARTIERPDVIYMDPMYPHRNKSALVKKEMRLLRALVGDDPDAANLLKAAIDFATNRVVVKRPKTASPINGPKPSMEIKSKTHRFDVYLL